jgi:hemerythrin
VALDELAVWECETQIKVQALGDEKKTHEKLLESTQNALSKRDFSSSAVISSAVAHVVALLKSHTPDLDTKKLLRDFPFDNDEERDALV